MVEALAVFVLVGLLAGIGLVGPAAPADVVVALGAAVAGAGLLLGVPTGLWYHLKLRACLRRAGVLPRRWWLRPVAHHGRVPAEERAGVLVWFYLGGAGFAATVLGCGIAALGVLLAVFGAASL